MKNINIKQANESDIPILVSILLDTVNWLNEMEQSLWSANDVKWDALSKKHQISDFFIAYTDGVPSGCMALIDYDPFFWPDIKKGESLFMHKLAVTKAARKSGVSDALVDFFKEQGKINGKDIIRLDTHAWRPKTRAFYERHGFISVGIKVCESDQRKNTALYVYKPITTRKALSTDAEALHDLYHNHLTFNPPKEPQNMAIWRERLIKFESDPNYHLIVGEIDNKVVSSVTLIIIENLTHNLRPYAVIENVVTHAEYRGKGYATAMMNKASEIAAASGCYKIMLLTGSKKDSTLKFYENCGFNKNDKTAFIKWL
jgi:GNAT superfamily N-acetyltransferase